MFKNTIEGLMDAIPIGASHHALHDVRENFFATDRCAVPSMLVFAVRADTYAVTSNAWRAEQGTTVYPCEED